jgi:hypothetical protein
VAGETLINIDGTNWKSIQSIKTGDQILAMGADGIWKLTDVVSSAGLGDTTKPFPYAIFVTVSTGASLIVSPDHVFYMPDGSLKRADRLTPTDSLSLADRQPAKITALTSGVYYGPMWNVTVSKDESPTTPFGHLINTAGVISADWALQRLQGEKLANGPQIGSKEYVQTYKAEISSLTKLTETIRLDDRKGVRFIPHVSLPALPPDAVNFLPPGEDIAFPGELQPLDYSIPYEMGTYLASHYKTYYPDVNFEIDWLNNDVNAVAFISGGQRYVRVYGGLLRHVRIQVEGAGLVLAHEIGHHFGGPPRYATGATWASCEGQSDYWGARIAQRKVWWGEYSIDQTTKGAAQLRDLFQNGLMTRHLVSLNATPKAGICTHPPAQCRYDTYMAGLRLQPKPACAGDP